eukprot:1774437-Rhodomonas_salina.4
MDSAGGRVKDRLGRGAVVEAMEATLQGMQRVAVVMEGAESTRGLRELMTVVLRGVEVGRGVMTESADGVVGCNAACGQWGPVLKLEACSDMGVTCY